MADHSTIEWTDATWNPITGCSIVSPGCTHCYAMKLAGTRLRNIPSRKGLTKDSKAGPVWTGEVRFNEGWLTQPLQWRRPRRIFVCAHGDLFAEGVSDEWIDKVFAVMALAPQHTFQVLTKRAERMREYIAGHTAEIECDLLTCRLGRMLVNVSANMGRPYPGNAVFELASNDEHIASHPESERKHFHRTLGWPLRNVWLGVSAERQKEADERIPDLLATPAAVRFVSLEPLLGPIDLTAIRRKRAEGFMRPLDGRFNTLDWIIVGGESGNGARPMHPDWVRSLRDQCAAAGKLDRLFFKQWGSHQPCEIVRVGDDGEVWRRTPSGSEFWFFDEVGKPPADLPKVRMSVVGKKKAGRLLDGVEHNGMP